MKFLATEQEIAGADWTNKQSVLEAEARHVYALYSEGTIREIYFTEEHDAILILETQSKEECLQILSTFPLVREKLIRFDVKQLLPYTGFQRLFKDHSNED